MTQTAQQMSIAGGGKTAEQQAAHDAAMAAKGADVSVSVTDLSTAGDRTTITQEPKQQQQAPASKAKRPDNVPEQFWNVETGQVNTEALLKSYGDLRTKLSQPKQQEQQQQSDQGTPKGDTPQQQSAIDVAAAEYAEKGELSAETMQALVKSGIPENTVKTYIDGIAAQSQLMTMQAHNLTGGKDNYEKMIAWASENLSDAEIDAFDNAVSDSAQRDSAIQGLFARFQVNGSYEPGSPVQGRNGQSTGEMFRSRHEMQAAMSDPRYKAGDRAFHADVQMKMANALAANIDLFS